MNSSDRSRRDFLQGLGLGTTALMTTGFGLHQSARASVGREGRKLGIALLGLGRYAGGELAPALKLTKQCYLAGVVTGHPEKGEKWAAQYNLDKRNVYNYENFDRIADSKNIDIVYVVTPPGLHPEFTIRAAKAGKHVISEKPMATSVADCDRMIAACKAAKVKLGIGYRVHYDPYHSEMVRLSSAHELGPMMKMKGRFAYTMGQHEFRVEKVLGGGGAMMDLGIYLIHAACMANGSPPVSVRAHEEPKMRPAFFNQVEETISWTMDFADGAKLEATTSFNGNGNEFRLEGPKGWLEMKNAFAYRDIQCDTSRGRLNYPKLSQQAAQMDDFADCVLTGRETPVPGELGRRDLRIITAIYESTRTGKSVKVGAA